MYSDSFVTVAHEVFSGRKEFLYWMDYYRNNLVQFMLPPDKYGNVYYGEISAYSYTPQGDKINQIYGISEPLRYKHRYYHKMSKRHTHVKYVEWDTGTRSRIKEIQKSTEELNPYNKNPYRLVKLNRQYINSMGVGRASRNSSGWKNTKRRHQYKTKSV